MEPLLPHFLQFYEQDEQMSPPLKLEACARLQVRDVPAYKCHLLCHWLWCICLSPVQRIEHFQPCLAEAICVVMFKCIENPIFSCSAGRWRSPHRAAAAPAGRCATCAAGCSQRAAWGCQRAATLQPDRHRWGEGGLLCWFTPASLPPTTHLPASLCNNRTAEYATCL